jgi:hypothetical protein
LTRQLTMILMAIRLLAITPSKSKTYAWEEVRKICVDYVMTGLESVWHQRNTSSTTPFRFVYMSGSNAERDPAKKPMILGDYLLMRVSQMPKSVVRLANLEAG